MVYCNFMFNVNKTATAATVAVVVVAVATSVAAVVVVVISLRSQTMINKYPCGAVTCYFMRMRVFVYVSVRDTIIASVSVLGILICVVATVGVYFYR